MRKTLALLALAGILALSAIAFGSPPRQKKTVKKNTQIVTVAKTDATHTADTSAVAARDAEARTVEAAPVVMLDKTAESNIGARHVLAANRYAVSPPARFDYDAGKGGPSLNRYGNSVGAGANRRTSAVRRV